MLTLLEMANRQLTYFTLGVLSVIWKRILNKNHFQSQKPILQLKKETRKEFEMWCLETIVALNEAASKRAKKGESELLAYGDVGITSTKTTCPVLERAEKFRVIKRDAKSA